MAPLKHIYPIRNEEIISELSETDVKIARLEIDVAILKNKVNKLNDLIIRQTEINKNLIDVLQDLNTRK
jgi:hypothetical protein